MDQLFDIQGLHVAITGASSGFGHHFAGLLAQRGARLTLGARRLDRLRERVESIENDGGSAIATALDVRERRSIEDFIQKADETFGTIDVLISNAGVEPGAKTYMMIDDEDWDTVLETNLKSAWTLSQLYTEHVVQGGRKKGNIVNISSITDRRTIKGQFPYAISKAGLTRMTEVLALEAPRYGIRVNALAPGYILTDVSRVLLESDQAPEFENRIPMRRFGQFEDLDGPLLLLVSEASRYMNGSVVIVDGGHTCASL